MKRIVVLGNSCSGKTMFASRLARHLSSKHVELDALFWEPNWTESRRDVFRARVTEALSADTWVVDGNYKGKIKDIVWPQVDTFVWLDPSLPTVLRRFFFRSLRRSFKKELLWGGCRETLKNSFFQRDSLLFWILSSYRKKAQDYEELVSLPPAGTKVFRLRNSGEVEDFFRRISNITRDTP